MYLQPTAKVNKELSSSETYYLYDNDTWIVIEHNDSQTTQKALYVGEQFG